MPGPYRLLLVIAVLLYISFIMLRVVLTYRFGVSIRVRVGPGRRGTLAPFQVVPYLFIFLSGLFLYARFRSF